MATEADRSPLCKNCAAPLSGPYCSVCGQKDAEVARPLATLLGDLFDGMFSLDSRAWRTIGLLIASPGRLTRAYFDGQRARYLPPIRLFLVCSLVFFAAVGLSGRHLLRLTAVPNIEIVDRGPAFLLSFDEEVDDEAPNGRTATTTTSSQAGYQAKLTMFPRADDPVISEIPAEALDELLERNPQIPKLARRLIVGFQHAVTDPQAFNASLNVWLPRMMFILVPVFALVLRLFYWRRGWFLAHHIFFALHFHSYVFVLLTLVLVLVSTVGGAVGAIVFGVASGGYLLGSMRTVYGDSRLATAGKWLAVTVIYMLIFLTTLTLTLLAALREL